MRFEFEPRRPGLESAFLPDYSSQFPYLRKEDE